MTQNTDAMRGLRVVVSRRTRETKDITSFELAAVDGSALPGWAPGTHVSLRLANRLTREYSLCGPLTAPTWSIAVRRETSGRGGSLHLHDDVGHGHELVVESVRNNFPLVEADEYLFIAGGIGITPLLPMAEAVAARRARGQFIYVAHGRDQMAFVDRLRHSGLTFDLWPTTERGRPGFTQLFAEYAGSATQVYVCGPADLIDNASRSWPGNPDHLHVEHFRSAAGADDASSTFEVVLARSGMTVQVKPGTSVLAAIEAAAPGLSIYQSCHEGVCGSCETPVLEGTPEHRDVVLSKRQRERGDRMMICVSRARSPRLVLDL